MNKMFSKYICMLFNYMSVHRKIMGGGRNQNKLRGVFELLNSLQLFYLMSKNNVKKRTSKSMAR